MMVTYLLEMLIT